MFVAYITTLRASDDPHQVRVVENKPYILDQRLGLVMVGEFDTKAEAEAAVYQAWNNWVETDAFGYHHWTDEFIQSSNID